MRPLTADDLDLDLDRYAGRRDEARQSIIALKKSRRVHVGDLVTVLFENRDTLRHQVQEMIAAEHITDPEKIAEELAVYNPLLPSSHELSATMFLEFPDMVTLKKELPGLVGIEHSLALVIGGSSARRR